MNADFWENVVTERERTIRLNVRVFLNGALHSQERVSVDTGALDALLPELAQKHAHLMADTPGYVELEFLDELNPQKRFFRMGTDPTAMVEPFRVDHLANGDVLSKWKGR